jgi:AAA15 family ATPase/GTPase
MSDELYKNVTLELLKDKKLAEEVKGFIQKADLGIQAIELTKVSLYRGSADMPRELRNTLITDDWPAVMTWHQKFNEKGEVIGNVGFLLDEQESEGTKKYFNLIGIFIKAIAEDRIVVIDEFDARLHTLLTKAIIKLFNSSKTKSRAQLLAASHDTALLDRELLRRDQIYFVEKNNYGASEVTSLVEYKPRKESPYDKNYLEGKFGAIPFIDSLDSFVKHG